MLQEHVIQIYSLLFGEKEKVPLIFSKDQSVQKMRVTVTKIAGSVSRQKNFQHCSFGVENVLLLKTYCFVKLIINIISCNEQLFK